MKGRTIGDRIALLAAALAGSIALLTLLGYAGFSLTAAIGQRAMSISTAALCFALAVTVLMTLRQMTTATCGIATIVLIVSVCLLASHVIVGHDIISPTIQNFLADHRISALQSPQTAAATAVCCALLAIGFIRSATRQPATFIAALSMTVSGLGMLGYAYNAQDFAALPLFHTFSLRTAISLFAIGTALLLSNHEAGVAEIISATTESGRAARRQLAMLIVAPTSAFLMVHLVAAEQVSFGAAAAFLVVSMVVPMALLILRDARAGSAVNAALIREAKAAAATAALESRYHSLFDRLETGFCVIEVIFDGNDRAVDCRFIEVNPAFEEQTGITRATGRSMREIAPGHEDYWYAIYGRVAKTGEAIRFEHQATALNRYFDAYAFPVDRFGDNHVAILFNDITQRRQAELDLMHLNETLEQRVGARASALEKAQEALRQAQKMEALGQLTGGLANDFNNLLQAITGSIDLARMRMKQSQLELVERHLSNASFTISRAAALTRQLLAFASQQTLLPSIVEPDVLISRAIDMIRSTIGRRIAIKWQPKGAWQISCDPIQLETTLLNLAINARDAMPEGGWLTIQANNVMLTEADVRPHAVPPGDYVEIVVADTGLGMDEGTKARAFEPFFTTKPPGSGSGLGLSQVYGFVRQSGGFVLIDSGPTRGTGVRLYLPRAL